MSSKVVKWLASLAILRNLKLYILAKAKINILTYYQPERAEVIDLIARIKKEREFHLLVDEAYRVYMAVRNTAKIEGDIAEIGVYQGGSAKLICEVKKGKSLHLFDTFTGIPAADKIDNFYYPGQFAASFEDVEKYLKEYSSVYFYKGLFPQTAGPIKDKIFSFVHLDVDTYKSTRSCLEFFYPRMAKGGIIISHDYINSDGVKKACNEFFNDKIEPIIEISNSQCLITKV